MLKRFFGGGSKASEDEKGSDFVLEDEEDSVEESAFILSLRLNLVRLIAYAESADVRLQREVAEKLANEAVKPERQVQIVELGGLKLLIPLTKSSDNEVQRLSAHALANLSVNADNQRLMAGGGAIDALIVLLDSSLMQTQRQSAKALANLGVLLENKRTIAVAGAIPKLVRLTQPEISIAVKIEAVAALANLAVNDVNEVEIEQAGGIDSIIAALVLAMEYVETHVTARDREYYNAEELIAQCARSLRNLSVNAANKTVIIDAGATPLLQKLTRFSNERIVLQSNKALQNLGQGAFVRK
jgi:hypothetical protein